MCKTYVVDIEALPPHPPTKKKKHILAPNLKFSFL